MFCGCHLPLELCNSWIWRHCAALKHQKPLIQQQGVSSQKTWILSIPKFSPMGFSQVFEKSGRRQRDSLRVLLFYLGGGEGTSHQAVQSPICQGRDREENTFCCKVLNIPVSITYFISFPSLIYWLFNDHEHQRWHKNNGHEQRTQKPPRDLPVYSRPVTGHIFYILCESATSSQTHLSPSSFRCNVL